jgi:hypothetical protein
MGQLDTLSGGQFFAVLNGWLCRERSQLGEIFLIIQSPSKMNDTKIIDAMEG